MRPVYLHAVAIADRRILAGPDGIEAWNPDGSLAAPDPRRFFPDQPRLGRLDLPSRFVLCAAGLLPAVPPDPDGTTAVVLGSSTGSLDSDLAFAASIADRPSPATYARTLPSTAGAELAIVRGCRGPNFAIIQAGIPGLLALAAAVHEIASGPLDAFAFAGEYDAVSGEAGPGRAVLCLLGRRPDPAGRSRPVSIAREAAPMDGPGAGLEALYGLFQEAPFDRSFVLEGTGTGSLVRVECGPRGAR